MNGCFWRSILLINPITHVVNYSARGLRGINIGIMIYKFVMSPFVYQILQGYINQPFTNCPKKLNIHPPHLKQWQFKANNLIKDFVFSRHLVHRHVINCERLFNVIFVTLSVTKACLSICYVHYFTDIINSGTSYDLFPLHFFL